MKRVLFRIESGLNLGMGSGHIYRALALAEALKEKMNTAFAANEDQLSRKLIPKQYRVFSLGPKPSFHLFKKALQDYEPDLVIFDKLSNNPEEIWAAKEVGALTVTFDDESSASQLADIRIDGIFPGRQSTYGGYDYLVLPSETGVGPKKMKNSVTRIFISFGGHDPEKLTERVLHLLRSSKLFNEKFKGEVICVCGRSYAAGVRRVAALYKNPAIQLRILVQTNQFNKLLASSDLAIMAAGLSFFQGLRLGIPILTLTQYKHQERTASFVHSRSAALFLGNAAELNKTKFTKNLLKLMLDNRKRLSLSHAARRLVDGKGRDRVRDILFSVVLPYSVRPATKQDSNFFFRTRNHPMVYRYLRVKKISRKSHDKNFPKIMREYSVVEHNKKSIGYFKLERISEVTLAINPKYFRKGHASWILNYLKKEDKLSALVHKDNIASKRLFTQGGFKKEKDNFELYRWQKRILPEGVS